MAQFASYAGRGLCKPRLIFPRINEGKGCVASCPDYVTRPHDDVSRRTTDVYLMQHHVCCTFKYDRKAPTKPGYSHCGLRCCPSVAKRGHTVVARRADTRNVSEDFQKHFLCPPQMLHAWQNESTFGKYGHVNNYIAATMCPRFACSQYVTRQVERKCPLVFMSPQSHALHSVRSAAAQALGKPSFRVTGS